MAKMMSLSRSGVAGIIALTVWCVQAMPAFSGEADVVDAAATRQPDGTWTFAVTVSHADEGWEHYANRWDVVGPDGTVYGQRELLHPHVDEQPFTRSLSGVVIPGDVARVVIRANDSVHGAGGREMEIDLRR